MAQNTATDDRTQLLGDDRVETDRGNYDVRTGALEGEHLVQDTGGTVSLGIGLGADHVAIDLDAEDDHGEMGVLGCLSADQARMIGEILVDAADHLEEE